MRIFDPHFRVIGAHAHRSTGLKFVTRLFALYLFIFEIPLAVVDILRHSTLKKFLLGFVRKDEGAGAQIHFAVSVYVVLR